MSSRVPTDKSSVMLCRWGCIAFTSVSGFERLTFGSCSDYYVWFERDTVCICSVDDELTYSCYPLSSILSCTFVPVLPEVQ